MQANNNGNGNGREDARDQAMTSKNTAREREELAWHEAAHALMAVELSLPFTYVTIDPMPGLPVGGINVRVNDPPQGATAHEAEKHWFYHMLKSAAGPAADLEFAPYEPFVQTPSYATPGLADALAGISETVDPASDQGQVWFYAAKVYPDDEATQRGFTAHAWKTAIELVHTYRFAINAIAQALLARGTLSNVDVAHVLDEFENGAGAKDSAD